MTTYRIAPAPRFSGMMTWSCSRCGREEVKPVFVEGPEGRAAYGSGCASVLLGIPTSRVKKQAAAVQYADDRAEEIRAERRSRYSDALAAFKADPAREHPALLSCRRTYHQTGGFDAHGGFPVWLARVAETGELS